MNIIETGLKFKRLNYGNNPKQLFLHHAEARHCTAQDIHNWHLDRGWSGAGYHFLVRKDGFIYRLRPEEAIPAQCKYHNKDTLAICAEGSYNIETMPLVQKNAIIQLGQYLCKKYKITDIKGHKECRSTDCPGNNYPLSEIKAAIRNGEAITTTNTTNTIKGRFGVVTAKSGLNVREKPDLSSKKIGALSNGSKVKLFKDCGNGWYSIYYGNHGGYVSKKYIKLI